MLNQTPKDGNYLELIEELEKRHQATNDGMHIVTDPNRPGMIEVTTTEALTQTEVDKSAKQSQEKTVAEQFAELFSKKQDKGDTSIGPTISEATSTTTHNTSDKQSRSATATMDDRALTVEIKRRQNTMNLWVMVLFAITFACFVYLAETSGEVFKLALVGDFSQLGILAVMYIFVILRLRAAYKAVQQAKQEKLARR